VLLTWGAQASAGPQPLESATGKPVVVDFDLGRFAGKWFEIARTDLTIMPGCKDAVDVYAPYVNMPNRLSALHSCKRAGLVIHRADGDLYAVDPQAPARMVLEARSTLGRPSVSDYHVIALDPEYNWAAIGEGTGQHVWVLSRLPALPEPTLRAIAAHLEQNVGYTDVQQRLRCVTQSAAQHASCTNVFGRL
jgi:apolipoprotein D and lipocalin family protein